jgi:Domain of unknown function (DUF4360)
MKVGRLACLSVLIALTSSVALHAQQGPNPNQPYVQSVAYGGNGCPQGSVATSFSTERTTFTLIFDKFVASSGPNVAPTENRKNCQFNITVHLPNGSGQFCTVLDYRGYVQLPGGANAEAKATYHNALNSYTLPDGQVIAIGNTDLDGSVDSFTGPISKDYVRHDSLDLSWNESEPIVKPINVNAQVRLFDAQSQGLITNDSIDGKLTPGPCEGADTTPPTIAIANPVTNGLYGLGAVVAPSFTCADEGSGVASCTGAPAIDTSSIGPHTFTVTAIDNAGNTSTASVSYAVGGKDECKGGGHSKFLAPTFRNQGQCVSSFVK